MVQGKKFLKLYKNAASLQVFVSLCTDARPCLIYGNYTLINTLGFTGCLSSKVTS